MAEELVPLRDRVFPSFVDSGVLPPFGTLTFGKYRGKKLSEVPKTYLKFLCCWEHIRDEDDKVITQEVEDPSEAQEFLLRFQIPTTYAARKFVRDERLCFECFRPLVPVGTSRANGAWHDDWETRRFHKRCWARIGRDSSESE